MAKIPTDERLLAEIYKRYERAFGDFSDENKIGFWISRAEDDILSSF